MPATQIWPVPNVKYFYIEDYLIFIQRYHYKRNMFENVVFTLEGHVV